MGDCLVTVTFNRSETLIAMHAGRIRLPAPLRMPEGDVDGTPAVY